MPRTKQADVILASSDDYHNLVGEFKENNGTRVEIYEWVHDCIETKVLTFTSPIKKKKPGRRDARLAVWRVMLGSYAHIS